MATQAIVESVWKGVNEVIDPATLAEGYLSSGKNIRCEDGKIKCRGGHTQLVISNTTTDGYVPVDVGTIYGVVDYVGISGRRSTISFGATEAYLTKIGSHRRTISYPDGVTISSLVQAFQAENEIRVMLGNDIAPLRWTEAMDSFEEVDQTTPPSSYTRMPFGQFGMYFYNRIWVLKDDTVYVSLVGEFDLFDPVYNLEVDIGSNDTGTGMYPYDKSTVVVTKKKSIYAIVNITSDLTSVELVKVSDTIGCEAPLGPFADGAKLYLPTTSGIFPVSQVFDTRLQASAVSMAQPIAKSFDAIDFSRFSECAGVAHNGYYYLAVPMQLDNGNGRVLVYSIRNGEWCGFDEHTSDYDVRGWTKMELGGEVVLGAVSKTGRIYLYGHGSDLFDGYSSPNSTNGVDGLYITTEAGEEIITEDSLYGLGNPENVVDSVAITRGYSTEPLGDSKFLTAEIKMESINPSYTIGYNVDGVSESGNVSEDNEPSPYTYSVIGKTAFDGTNQYGDFLNPYRKDYSLISTSAGYQIESTTNNTNYILLDLKQSSVHRLRLVKGGRYFQVVISNKRGQLDIVSIAITSMGTGRSFTKSNTI